MRLLVALAILILGASILEVIRRIKLASAKKRLAEAGRRVKGDGDSEILLALERILWQLEMMSTSLQTATWQACVVIIAAVTALT